MPPKFHSLKVQDVNKETEDTVSVAFTIPDEYSSAYKYSAGQYITLKKDINGAEVRRSYSLCSAPYENEWRVAIKHVDGGQFSTYANEQLEVGEEIDVMTPMGNFTTDLDPKNEKNYIFFAAGSGITPVISLVKEILHEEPSSTVTLFYGNRGFSSIIFREELEGLKNTFTNRFRVIHFLSRENMGVPIQYGRIDAEKCHQLFSIFGEIEEADAFFVCGPEPMINAVSEGLEEKDISKDKIHFELFTSPLGKLRGAEKKKNTAEVDDEDKSDVVVIYDDTYYNFKVDPSGASILDKAHERGTDLPFACKGGVCCTCKSKLLEGEVTMDVNYALEQDQVDEGYILTCQSHPKTKNVKITFDE